MPTLGKPRARLSLPVTRCECFPVRSPAAVAPGILGNCSCIPAVVPSTRHLPIPVRRPCGRRSFQELPRMRLLRYPNSQEETLLQPLAYITNFLRIQGVRHRIGMPVDPIAQLSQPIARALCQ
jgi:hypothetical protein